MVDIGGQFNDVDWEYGGASKECCTAPNNWAAVIGDKIEGIWKDWSGSTTTSADTTSPHSGSACLKVAINNAWGELQIGSDFGPSSSDFTGLEFYLKRDSSTPASATLTFGYGSSGTKKTISDIPTTWTKYTIENSEVLSSTTKISTINFQSNVAGTYYFDDMTFVLPGGGLSKTCASGVEHDGEGGGGGKSGASMLTFSVFTLFFVLVLSTLL